MTVLHEPTDLQRRYFAAANTAEGFVCYYDAIFSSLRKLYIVKGGPGTGKSRLMWDVANEAKNQNLSVELYFCSSDPHSLDGLVIPALSIGILDGTAPHVRDPAYPGVRDDIINLGEFWKSDLLNEHLIEIQDIIDEKNRKYVQTYHYLNAADKMDSLCRRMLLPAVLKDKMQHAAARSLRSLKSGDGLHCSVKLRSAISMRGIVTLDTYEHIAASVVYVRDKYHTGYLFLRDLIDILKEKKQEYTVSYTPLNPAYEDALYIPACDTSYIVTESLPDSLPQNAAVVNMDRFLDHEVVRANRAKLRFGRQCCDALMEGAISELSEIGRLHFTLEEIYISAMDFEKKEDYTKKLLNKIFRAKS